MFSRGNPCNHVVIKTLFLFLEKRKPVLKEKIKKRDKKWK
jgi:hypothetical protein